LGHGPVPELSGSPSSAAFLFAVRGVVTAQVAAKTTRCCKAQESCTVRSDQCCRSRVFLISTEGGELCSDVMVSNITDDLEYWHKRAEESRTLAEQMKAANTKSIMLGIAASYEKIAKWTEERREEPR
jgi:hypothetical protein